MTSRPAAGTGRVLDVGLALPTQDGLSASDYVGLARLGEEEGLHTVTVGEIAGAEAFSLLGAIASTTQRIRLGSGVVAIYNRSPVLTAMGFVSLESLAPGRVFAGLGTGSHRVVEDWNDRELRAPLETMRAFVTAFRAICSGERIDARGVVSVRGFRLQHPPPGPVPVFLGGFQRGMLRLAGAIADGVHFALWPPDELPARIADVHDGASEAGRDPASIEILASVHAYAGSDVDGALERLRRVVLEYAVRPTHRAAYLGTFPEIERATELWNAGDRRGALALVPDEAVFRLCAVGSTGTVVERLRQARAAGVTMPLLNPHSIARGDVAVPTATVAAVAAALRRSTPEET